MWIRDDDQFMQHPKFRRAATLLGGPHAFAQIVCAFKAAQSYANHNETGGFFDDHVVKGFAQFLDQPETVAAAMVGCAVKDGGAGLWEREEGGYRIHDYEQYVPPEYQQERVRELRAAAGRKGGQRSGAARRAKARSKPEANPEANGQATAKQNDDAESEVTAVTTADATIGLEANRSNGQANAKPVPGTRYPASSKNDEAGTAREAWPPHGRRGLVSGPDPRVHRWGRVNVWGQLHAGFRARLGLDDVAEADRRLNQFYDEVEARWTRTGEIPAGEPFKVWQREFDQAFANSADYRRAAAPASTRPGGTSPRWDALCARLEERGAINRHGFYTWLKPCRVVDDSGQVLRVSTNRLAVDWIQKHYQQAIDEALHDVAPDCRIELVPDVDDAAMPAAAEA